MTKQINKITKVNIRVIRNYLVELLINPAICLITIYNLSSSFISMLRRAPSLRARESEAKESSLR
jgi:hypothetical protein